MNNTIEYNQAYQGGGIVVQGHCQPVFNQDVIRYNQADDRGGGMVCWSPSITTLNNVSITNNTSWWGAGIGIYDAEIFLNNCQVSFNRAENLGGGIHADFSTLHIQQTTFQRDTSDSGSGGVHAWYCEVEADLCQFSENMAINGGAFHSDFSQVQINNCSFLRNVASNGAAIHAYCIDLAVDSCIFSQNIAQNTGAGIEYTADTAGFSIPFQLELTHSRFELNYAITLGGGVNINQLNSDSSLVNLLIDHCTFDTNSADHVASLRVIGSIHNFIVSNSIFIANSALKWVGGPYFLLNCRGEVFNCLISSNQASIGGGSYSGGGATVAQEAQVDFYNCTFTHNSSSYGAGLHVRVGSIVNVMNSVFWGNFPEQINLISQTNRIASLTLNNCDIENGIDSILLDSLSILQWGQGNLNSDPVFINPAGNDYHLQDDSPCIGAGVDSLQISGNWYIAPSSDLEGNPRPAPAGSMPDMGAYESPLATPVGISKDLENLPEQFCLYQNYPNPFNASTVISWQLAVGTWVNLSIYDLSGREVTVLVNEKQKAGYHEIDFKASKLASGMYFYRLKTGEISQMKKALLLK